MKCGIDTIPDVFGWLVHSSVAETKSHVSKASVATLYKALREVEGKNKGKTEAIRRELFKRLEVGDDVVICNGKACKVIAISANGQYLKLDNAPGMYGWKDIEVYGCPF
jgi:hypothetical protein